MGNHPSSNNGNGNNNTGGIRTSRAVNADANGITPTNSLNNNNGSSGTGSITVSPSVSATSSSSSSHHRPPPQPSSQHQHQQHQQPVNISVGVTTIRNMFHQLHTKHTHNNALGLSKVELDERCKPSGYVYHGIQTMNVVLFLLIDLLPFLFVGCCMFLIFQTL
jgi:hypothetical protein